MSNLPARITLSRAKGWRLQDVAPGAVKVDRGGKGLFGNPWIVGEPGQVDLGDCIHRLPASINSVQACAVYREWLEWGHIYPNALPDNLTTIGREAARQHLTARRTTILSALTTLRGKPLACWCKPGCPCHADILLRLANG